MVLAIILSHIFRRPSVALIMRRFSKVISFSNIVSSFFLSKEEENEEKEILEPDRVGEEDLEEVEIDLEEFGLD